MLTPEAHVLRILSNSRQAASFFTSGENYERY